MAISHKMYLPKIYRSPPAQKILDLPLLQVWRSFKLTLPDNIEQLSLLVFFIHRSSLGSCNWSICNHCCSWMLPCCWTGVALPVSASAQVLSPSQHHRIKLNHCCCYCCSKLRKKIIVSNSNCESVLIIVLIM